MVAKIKAWLKLYLEWAESHYDPSIYRHQGKLIDIRKYDTAYPKWPKSDADTVRAAIANSVSCVTDVSKK